MPTLQEQFGGNDIYLFDQLVRGNVSKGMSIFDAGTYVVTYGPTYVTERGKYLNVWTQVNGRWKIKANMWNTDALTPQKK